MSHLTSFAFFSGILLLLSFHALAEERATCIEQDVVREFSKGQPSIKGKQRICFTKTAIRNETTYDGYTTVAILDLKAGTIALIPGNQHEYVQMHLVDYRKLVKMRMGALGLNDSAEKLSVVKTDMVKTIRSWSCVLYTFEHGGKIPIKGQMWVTHHVGVEFKDWFALMDSLGLIAALGDLGKQAAEIDGLPISVRIEQTVFGQSLVTSTELTSVEVNQATDGLFVVPAGYKKMDVESIPGFSE